MDTIFAVSSGRPPAAIALIRISGPDALAAATAMAGSLPPPRKAAVRPLRNRHGELVDRALVLVFPGPRSATGEDLVELHCHGGRAVVAVVEEDLAARGGLRLAEPGEFTRRALLHGRIDLAQAQGLADLLEAETETQRRAAMLGTEGRISSAVNGWIERIMTLSAAAEALLDFADEGDVGDDAAAHAGIRNGIATLAREIHDALQGPSVERLKDGVRVVIAGPPNAGKSTLFNRLCEREAAIVSPVAGTTRDRIEAVVQRNGQAYLLLDTAGLHLDAGDPVEAEGIARARQAVLGADVLLWLADTPPPRDDALWLYGRADLADRSVLPAGPTLAVSNHDSATIDSLWAAIEGTASTLPGSPDGLALHAYQRESCRQAVQMLNRPANNLLVLAEQLRSARGALEGLTGATSAEAMLDALFERFCIGK